MAAPRPLPGIVVAITGGARGIGRATAEALVARGARVAIGDVDLDLARRTAGELEGGTLALPLDVTTRESFADFLDTVETRLGPIDVLVNNAGIMPIGPFLAEDDATAVRMVDINLHGVILGTKLALPGMIARGRGHIVNISSAAGKVPVPHEAVYTATKHAVVGLSEAVRAEIRGTGVDLTCVMPNLARTELGAGMRTTRGMRLVEPADIAAAIVGAIERPRFDVYVPASLGPMILATTLLPRAARERLSRLLGIDRIAADPDDRARAAYEARAAAAPSRLAAELEATAPDSA